MQKKLQQLEDFFLRHAGMNFTPQTRDIECEEYSGYTCLLDTFTIKFRKAKITPKKIGQFVTVWERNAEGITTPFSISDPFDFYLILTKASSLSLGQLYIHTLLPLEPSFLASTPNAF